MKSGGSVRRLVYFVSASLLVHLVLLTVWHGDRSTGSSEHGTFKVTLVARRGDRSDTSLNSVPAAGMAEAVSVAAAANPVNQQTDLNRAAADAAVPLVTLKSAVHAIPESRESTARAATETPHRTTTGSKTRTTEPARPQTDDISRYQAAMLSGSRTGSVSDGQHDLSSAARHSRINTSLFKALLPIFNYPSLARRRGWEGRARIGLHVEHDGDLTNVYLVESSGHDLLDRAALKNIAAIANIPDASRWLNSAGMDIVLPVSYLLGH